MAESILEKLEKEEKEAEKLLYGDGESEESLEDAAVESEDIEPAEQEEVSEEVREDPKTSGGVKTRTSWKKRFTSYKASTDLTLNQLRTERTQQQVENEELRGSVAQLTTQMKGLERKLTEKVDVMEGVITPEEAELLGPEAVAVLKKIASNLMVKSSEEKQPELDTLKIQLAELQRKREEDSKRQREDDLTRSMGEFKTRLVTVVPDFDVIDIDEKFGEFLEGVDEASGLPRFHLYKTAIEGRDVLGVARFYNDFRGTRPKSKEDILEEQVVPQANAAEHIAIDTAGGTQKRFHVSEYGAFMDDVNKGTYRGREKEAKKIEMMFDKAFVEDRVDGM